jgi:hypothetical protein
VNEEKNNARERTFQNNTRGAKNAYKLARTKEDKKEEFVQKKGKAARRRGFN